MINLLHFDIYLNCWAGVGLHNKNNWCYINSLMQVPARIFAFTALFAGIEPKENYEKYFQPLKTLLHHISCIQSHNWAYTQQYFECNGESVHEFIVSTFISSLIDGTTCCCGSGKKHGVKGGLCALGEGQTFFNVTIGAWNDRNKRAKSDEVTFCTCTHAHTHIHMHSHLHLQKAHAHTNMHMHMLKNTHMHMHMHS